MGKLDKAKETINQFRVWLASNMNQNAVVRIVLASFSVFILSGLIVFIEKRIRKTIEELEEL